jgi:hypothetical protein
VTVRIVQTQAAPELEFRVTGREELVILGEKSEPLARIGPSGAFVNTRSPTWYSSQNPNKNPPRGVSADLPPAWKRISEKPELSYVELRAEWPHSGPPEDVRKIGERATILSWSIPATYGGRPVQIQGHVDWVPRPVMLELPILLMAALGWGVWRLVSGRAPQVAPAARAMALATAAGVIVELMLMLIDLAGRPSGQALSLAPLLVAPGLILMAYLIRFVLRSEGAAILAAASFGAYIMVFAAVRLVRGIATSTTLRLALVTQMLLGITLLLVGIWYRRHPELVGPSPQFDSHPTGVSRSGNT